MTPRRRRHDAFERIHVLTAALEQIAHKTKMDAVAAVAMRAIATTALLHVKRLDDVANAEGTPRKLAEPSTCR